jgi:hypothetical protein
MRTNIIGLISAIEKDKIKLKKNGILPNGIMDIRARNRTFKGTQHGPAAYGNLIEFIDSYEPIQERLQQTGIACYVKDSPPSGDYFSFFLVVAENHPLFNVGLLEHMNFSSAYQDTVDNFHKNSSYKKMIAGLFNNNRELKGLIIH